jgi:predicted alpha/beta-hydrolase family hydrolase
MNAEPVTIDAGSAGSVSGLLQVPPQAKALYVFAHGAGAGMAHPSMTTVAEGLAERHIATLRYQFPYMEQRRKRPDPPPIAHAAVRAAVEMARTRAPKLPLFAGGRSFGGRMTSQAQASAPLAGVRGLIFFAFPLHPAKKPSRERAKHLSDVDVPMLFLQGTRDALAFLDELTPVCDALGSRATLKLLENADHSFHVPARSGRTDAQVRAEMLDFVATWIGDLGP